MLGLEWGLGGGWRGRGRHGSLPFRCLFGCLRQYGKGREDVKKEPGGCLCVPKMGGIIPNMGSKLESPSALAGALFSAVELRVLALLFGQPDRSFQGAELIRLAHSGDGAVHRVLTRLAGSGLVTVTRIGNQKHYRANREAPIFEELHGLIIKTVGLRGPLQVALAPLARRITAAFVASLRREPIPPTATWIS